MATDTPSAAPRSGRRAPQWLALALHLVVGVFPYAASGLLAPPVGLAVLAVVWIACLVALWRWRPANPWLALLVPAGAVAVWFAVMAFGDYLLGWTA